MKDSERDIEERLRDLVPVSASPELKSRIANSLGASGAIGSSPKKFRLSPGTPLGLGLAAAACVALACGVVFLRSGDDSPEQTLTIGQEQILVGVSEPNFIEVAGAEPMWEIEIQILNRAIVDTPGGGRETILVPEERRVFVPAVYQ